MVTKLTQTNVLSVIKNNTFNANNSLRSNFTLYTPEIVKENKVKECSVLFVFTDKNKQVYSTLLENVISDVNGYLKFLVQENNDFGILEGNYTGYILIFNPTTNTHISSTTIRFNTTESIEEELNLALMGGNFIDNVFIEFNEIKNTMNDYLEKIKQLTELNISINNELKTQKGDN